MSLREKQMEERRRRILDTTEALIRQTGGTDFSVRSLAAAAEVAPATPFNLFGSKEGLLYALLSRSLDDIISEGLTFKSTDRSYHIVEATKSAVDTFVRDPEFMRPLYRVLLGVNDEIHRPQFMERSLSYWRFVVDTLPPKGMLRDKTQRHYAAVSLQAQFLGLLEYWVHNEFEDEQFRRHAVYGVLTSVLGLVDKDVRAKIVCFLSEVAPGIWTGG